jgi:hypothetical protein
MLNTQWVISFGRSSRTPRVRPSERFGTAHLVEARRRQSREMFAVTRSLLAEARAVLESVPLDGSVRRASR